MPEFITNFELTPWWILAIKLLVVLTIVPVGSLVGGYALHKELAHLQLAASVEIGHAARDQVGVQLWLADLLDSDAHTLAGHRLEVGTADGPRRILAGHRHRQRHHLEDDQAVAVFDGAVTALPFLREPAPPSDSLHELDAAEREGKPRLRLPAPDARELVIEQPRIVGSAAEAGAAVAPGVVCNVTVAFAHRPSRPAVSLAGS